MEIGHEIISTAFLSLLLIQVGQLSVTGKRMCTKVLVNHLGLNLPRKSVVRLTDCLNITIVVEWDIKPQNKQTSIRRNFEKKKNTKTKHIKTITMGLNCE